MPESAVLPPVGLPGSGRVGALPYDDTAAAYEMIAAVVAALRQDGVAVGGLLQRPGQQRQANGKPSLWLEDIGSGQRLRLDEQRGPGARACVLDTDALARGAWLLRQAVASKAAVIIVSRFGAVEAEGGGLRHEIAEAICSGAAVLIPVRDARLPDLQEFLGFAPLVLPSSSASIVAWCRGAVPVQ